MRQQQSVSKEFGNLLDPRLTTLKCERHTLTSPISYIHNISKRCRTTPDKASTARSNITEAILHRATRQPLKATLHNHHTSNHPLSNMEAATHLKAGILHKVVTIRPTANNTRLHK